MSPVYPTYEGYRPNADGTFTLVFGYHSENSVAVDIEPGTENGFDPGPADRGQTTRFLPGRHRDVCVMVVGPEFQGRNLQWRIRWGANSNITTDRGGPNPLYLLEEIGSAYRATTQIDTEMAPRGVCLNRPPSVRIATTHSVTVGESLRLSARVSDDGLPRDSALQVTWIQRAGPAAIALERATSPSVELVFPTPGIYELEVSVDDGERSTSRPVAITVN